MKKTFFYLFAIFCCFAMCLVSCEKPQVEGGGEEDELEDVELPEGTIRLQALTSQYGSGPDMGYSNASHNFLLMFATEDCEEPAEIIIFLNGYLTIQTLLDLLQGSSNRIQQLPSSLHRQRILQHNRLR